MAAGALALVTLTRNDERITPNDGRITNASEFRACLRGLESQDRIRELLGDPTRVERRPRSEIWDYTDPFEGATHVRIAFGERRRAAWFATSGSTALLTSEARRELRDCAY